MANYSRTPFVVYLENKLSIKKILFVPKLLILISRYNIRFNPRPRIRIRQRFRLIPRPRLRPGPRCRF